MRYAAVAQGGSNISPALTIANVPTDTAYLAIVMDDDTPPCGTGTSACVHWGVFNLLANKTSIAENENLGALPGVVLGQNYSGSVGYAGPNPPNAHHVYTLTVYALNASATPVAATPMMTRAQFQATYANSIVSKATITGKFPN